MPGGRRGSSESGWLADPWSPGRRGPNVRGRVACVRLREPRLCRFQSGPMHYGSGACFAGPWKCASRWLPDASACVTGGPALLPGRSVRSGRSSPRAVS